ncbi:MAG TPA: inositol monophosphatase family protein, partial [Acidimicrobiales bacterium]
MLSDVDVERCGQVAAALGQWATQRIGRQRPTPEQTSTKAHAADWVTTVDVAVEEHVRAELGRHFPDHAIIGEELGGDEPADGRPRWYLDPIDGTTNFVHGLPRYSFSLAVADEAGIAVGVVADPSSGEILQAGRDRGATLDGKRVRCSPATTLVGGIVCVELAGYRCWPGLTDLLGQL